MCSTHFAIVTSRPKYILLNGKNSEWAPRHLQEKKKKFDGMKEHVLSPLASKLNGKSNCKYSLVIYQGKI